MPVLGLLDVRHDRRREDLGLAFDVAADDEHRADLGDRAAEPDHHRGEDPRRGLLDHGHLELSVIGPQDERGVLHPPLDGGHDGRRDAEDDRGHDEGLGEDHAKRGVEEAEEAEGPATGEQEVDQEARQDGREPVQGEEDRAEQSGAPDLAEAEERPQGDRDHGGDQRRTTRHEEGEERDADDVSRHVSGTPVGRRG